MTEVVEQQPPPQNGIDLSAIEDEDSNKARPADIEQDMREMERRKRVESIMGSKLFREELERIVDAARDGGATGILQQLSDFVGMPASRVAGVYKSSNCMVPINDIRGVESMGYGKGEKILRCKLAATFRLLDLYGWTQGLGAQITARLKVDQEYFLVNPYGLLYHEVTASSLNKVDMQGHIVEQGTTNFGVNKSHFILHSVLHAARPDIRCAIYIGCSPVVAIASLKAGLLPLTKDACVLGEITTHHYSGALLDAEERDKLVRNLGPNSKVLLLSNYGALCCGETIEEAFFAACHIVQACETQLKLLPVGIDNLVLIPEESRKSIFEQSRRPPEDLERKFAAVVSTMGTTGDADVSASEDKSEATESAPAPSRVGAAPKWRVGGAEFEALMRMLDNAGYRTGYIYRHPLVKSDPPKPKNDVELPPAVSSLGYLLEEEELFRQGIWKKGDLRKGGDRSRWLNSPNVYQKVEVLETGTPDPKKITKWVADGSPTHSTPVRIEDPLQFVPAGTNPKEFKRLQQQIKDNRRADKISAGPQSHILEGVTWDEANRIKDATVSSAGDHVVLMGAASKGIIQRGFQHNATVYKAPYAKNPFDSVTDDELNEYKRTVERKKKSIHGEYTDTDFSESEALSSLPTSGAQIIQQTKTAAVSQSEPEDVSEHQVIRIQTQQAPVPSQPEVVLSDATLSFLNGERSHTATNRKPPTGRDAEALINCSNEKAQVISDEGEREGEGNIEGGDDLSTDRNRLSSPVYYANKENFFAGHENIRRNALLIAELKKDLYFQRQKSRFETPSTSPAASPPPPPPPSEVDADNDDYRADKIGGSFSTNAQHYSNESRSNSSSPPPLETFVPISIRNIRDLNVGGGGNNTNVNATTTPASSCDCCSMYCEPYSQQREEEDYVVQQLPELIYDSATEPDYVGLTTAYAHHRRQQRRQPQQEPEPHTHSSQPPSNHSYTQHPNHPQHVYRKSIFCYTPFVCDTVFESMQRPLDNNNDLILNIPFMSPSPLSPSIYPNTPPRKARSETPPPSRSPTRKQLCADGAASARTSSPYRTVSHFGFKSPQFEPQPDHKHIPGVAAAAAAIEAAARYVPLRKSASYEEIFSSPRFIDLCENCFEKVVRYKPELGQMRARLRNLSDFHATTLPTLPPRLGGGTSLPPCDTSQDVGVGSSSAGGGGGAEGIFNSFAPSCSHYEDCLYPPERPEAISHFSSQLEPVLEVEEYEADSGERSSLLDEHEHEQGAASDAADVDADVGALERTTSNSTFFEKISRLNYSEESASGTFTHMPHTVSSNITVDLDVDDRDLLSSSAIEIEKNEEAIAAAPAVMEQFAGEVKLLNTVGGERKEQQDRCRNESRRVPPTGQAFELTHKIAVDAEHHVSSVTEIWEFGNWRERNDDQQDNDATVASEAAPEYQLESANVDVDNVDGKDSASNDRSSISSNSPTNRSNEHNATAARGNGGRGALLLRKERVQRRREFTDIWEDHVHYYETKARHQQHNPSDTESARDERRCENWGTWPARSISDGDTAQQHEEEEEAKQQQLPPPAAAPDGSAGDHLEVFASRSYLVKQPRFVHNEDCNATMEMETAEKAAAEDADADAASNDNNNWGQEPADNNSDGGLSAATFNLSASRENLFFRAASGSESSLANCDLPRMDDDAFELDRAPFAPHLAALSQAQSQDYHLPSAATAAGTPPRHGELQVIEDECDTEILLLQQDLFESMENSAAGMRPIMEQSDASSTAANMTEVDYTVSLEHSYALKTEIQDPVEQSLNDDTYFNEIERKILYKIAANNLSREEEIFDKIETTIRNKITPSKIEQLILNQRMDCAKPPAPNATSTPTLTPTIDMSLNDYAACCSSATPSSSRLRMKGANDKALAYSGSGYSLKAVPSEMAIPATRRRHARSLTPQSPNSSTAASSSTGRFPYITSGQKAKVLKTWTPAQQPPSKAAAAASTCAANQTAPPQSTWSTPELSGAAQRRSQPRNFVLENIRSAAKQRPFNTKRLQYCRGLGTSAAAADSGSNGRLNQQPSTSNSNSSLPATRSPSSLSLHSENSAGGVFTFQSKMVGSSPRFWVSLAQQKVVKRTPANKAKLPPRRLKRPAEASVATSTSPSSSSADHSKNAAVPIAPDAIPDNVSLEPTRVDVTLEQLDGEVKKLSPRLDGANGKIDDYDHHMSKIMRNVDECIVEQSNIADAQPDRREQTMLDQQHFEQLVSQMQNICISETED